MKSAKETKIHFFDSFVRDQDDSSFYDGEEEEDDSSFYGEEEEKNNMKKRKNICRRKCVVIDDEDEDDTNEKEINATHKRSRSVSRQTERSNIIMKMTELKLRLLKQGKKLSHFLWFVSFCLIFIFETVTGKHEDSAICTAAIYQIEKDM